MNYKYNRHQLEQKKTRGQDSLRSLAIQECKSQGSASSWIQTSTKNDLIEWLSNVKITNSGSNNGDRASVIKTEKTANSDSEGGNSDGNSDEDTPEDTDSESTEDTDSESTENSEIKDILEGKTDSNQTMSIPKENSEVQFVTSKGIITSQEAKTELQVDTIIDSFNQSLEEQGKINKTLATHLKSVMGANNSAEPTTSTFVINSAEPIKLSEHRHPQFNNILTDLTLGKQALMIGEAGTGKTFMGGQLAKVLGVKFAHISCSEGMAEAHLLGRMLFDGEYVLSEFINCYENGGLFLMDELDSCDANTLTVLNSALANGICSVPNRKDNPTAKRHANFYFLGAMNTFGTDNGSFRYCGRNKLDSATLDRFVLCRHIVSYDTKLEKSFCLSDYTFNGKTYEMSENGGLALYNSINSLREKVNNEKMDKIVSTRLFIDMARKYACLGGGVKIAKILMSQFMLGWSKQEEARVDVPSILKTQDWSK